MAKILKYGAYEFNPEKTDNFSGVFISDKETEEESNLGKLIILIRFDTREKRIKDLIEKIKDALFQQFYLTDQDNPESALEASCKFINDNLAEIMEKNTNRKFNKVNILVAAIKDDQIFLSRANNGVSAWLLRNNKFFNILGDEASKNEPLASNKKVFDQLVSGKIEANDALLFSSATIFNYFSQNKIKETMAYLPSQGISYFRRMIENTIKKDSFAIVLAKFFNPEIIQAEKKKELINNLKQQGVSNYSMDELVSLEKNTSSLLKSSLLANIRKLFLGRRFIQNIFSGTNDGRSSLFNLLKNKIRDAGQKTINALTQIFGKDDENEELTGQLASLTKGAPGLTTLKGVKINDIRKKFLSTKFLLILSAVLIFLFIISLFVLSYQHKKNIQKNEIALSLAEINKNIEAAESSLIFQDKSKARVDILKAQDLLISFANQYRDSNDAATLNPYIEKINDIMIKSFNVTVLDNLQPLIDLSLYLDLQAGDKVNSITVADKVYITAGSKILIINPVDKKVSTVNPDKGEFTGGTVFNKNLIFLSKLGQFYLYNPSENTLAALKIDMSGEKTVAAYGVYSQKMYIADREKNTIYKHDFINDGFTAGKIWLKDDTDISRIIDFAIDGSVYLLSAKGEITKIFTGKRQNFQIKDLDKPLAGATKIYTQPDLTDLFILDNPNKRIVLINKEKASIEKQFYSASFSELQDFAITNNGKTIYLINDNKLYQIKN